MVNREGIDEGMVKFELALLNSLQTRSRRILQLVGYFPKPMTIITRFYPIDTSSSRIHNLA